MTRSWLLLLAISACQPTPHHLTVRAEYAKFEGGGQSHRAPRAPVFDERKYNACIAAFDANYDAWLPTNREAKAVLARVKDKSPYLAVPALLAAVEQVDKKAALRQTRTDPPGAIYAPATRLELATALVALAARTHAGSCVEPQFRVEVDNEYQPPLTGDRERDKLVLCGGSSAEAQAAWLEARRAAADAFNQPNTAIHDDHTRAFMWSQVASFASNAKEATLALTAMSGNRRCVPNGRVGRHPDGSWGPLCDIEELPAYSVGRAKSYKFAPQELPFQLKRGDQVVVTYELDPDAPAGADKVARPGGWWWLTSVTRGGKPVFEGCGTAAAHEALVNSPLRPLQVMTRRD